MRTRFWLAVLGILAGVGFAQAAPIRVVVAENVYGEAVERIGGGGVTVTALIASSSADPHDYEPTPFAARAIADAQVVIYNGLGYDWWVELMLVASGAPTRVAVSVAALLSRSAGDNPHLWYDPRTMPALADAVVGVLSRLDPQNASAYADRGAAYKAELAAIALRVVAIRAAYSGTPVTATEPVFGYMADALSLDMRNGSFQRAVMNETEPSARDVVAVEADVRSGAIKVLFYNSQVKSPVSDRLLSLARDAGVPVVAVPETKPAGVTYVQWLHGLLDATETALAGQRSRARP